MLKPLFPAGPPVEGDGLVGREEVVQDIVRLLEMGQSVILMSPRRYGKTSVMIEVMKRLKRSGHFTAQLDFFAIPSKRVFVDRWVSNCLANNPSWLEKSWNKMKRGGLSILEGLQFKPSIADMEIVLQLSLPHVDINDLIDKCLDFPDRFAKKHNKLLFYALDEFQSILDIGDVSLVKMMRSHIQRQQNVRYLFAGSQEGLMSELFKQKRHAFYRFARVIELGVISEGDFVSYIRSRFRKQKITLKKNIADLIYEKTGGQPYYTQLLCQMLYELAIKLGKKSLEIDDVSKAVSLLMMHEDGLFSDWWDNLSKKKHAHAILSFIAEGKSPYEVPDVSPANLNRVITDLKKSGYIGKKPLKTRKSEFFIKDRFFRRYVSKLVS